MSKYRSSQVENWGKRRNTTGRGHCFGGGARFEWDMATNIGTYQGDIIGRAAIRLSFFLAPSAIGMLWGCIAMSGSREQNSHSN